MEELSDLTKAVARQRPVWVDDGLFPFMSRFVDIDGHVIHYVDEGVGPTLLMLHGNPTWSFVWRQAIDALCKEFRCIALDLPGFGLSTARPGYHFLPEQHAAAVTEFVDKLELKDATLVAQDWGGPIGLSTVESRPEVFKRLVLANTWAWLVNGDLHFEIFSKVMGGSVGRELIKRFNFCVNALIPAGHRRRKLDAHEMSHYRHALATRQRRLASAVLPRAITHSRDFLAAVEARLPALAAMPTLFVWGDADITFRKRELARFERLLPNHETVVLRGVGHYLQSDAPHEFASAIRSWMQSPS